MCTYSGIFLNIKKWGNPTFENRGVSEVSYD
jgi:hypothetical protein